MSVPAIPRMQQGGLGSSRQLSLGVEGAWWGTMTRDDLARTAQHSVVASPQENSLHPDTKGQSRVGPVSLGLSRGLGERLSSWSLWPLGHFCQVVQPPSHASPQPEWGTTEDCIFSPTGRKDQGQVCMGLRPQPWAHLPSTGCPGLEALPSSPPGASAPLLTRQTWILGFPANEGRWCLLPNSWWGLCLLHHLPEELKSRC